MEIPFISKTGGILRAIDRGKEAIETLMYAFLFSIGPTLLEICFTWFILFIQYKIWYFLVTFVTVGYIQTRNHSYFRFQVTGFSLVSKSYR